MTKKLGILSFGHYLPRAHMSAADSLTQALDITIGAEDIGFDGAWTRVHHYQHQFASPWALIGAIAARTQQIEIGTAVIDMRYENPLNMAELAASADLISGGRLQLGLGRGSQEPALRGWESFGFRPAEGDNDADMARDHTDRFRTAISGTPVAVTNPTEARVQAPLSIQPQSRSLPQRIWWGSATRQSAQWAGEQGMHLLSSTLLSEDTGVPFSELQAEQIRAFRGAWRRAGHPGTPRVAVVRSILPVISKRDMGLFGPAALQSKEQVGRLNGAISRFGKSFIGTPQTIMNEIEQDNAVKAADTLLLTIPNTLGVEENLRILGNISDHLASTLHSLEEE